MLPYGARADSPAATVSPPGSTFGAAFGGLLVGARVPAFWLLAGSFAICGMTTNGLIGTHFIPAANDHGMPTTVAAGLLAHGRGARRRRAPSARAGSPTGSIRGYCWSSTTPDADCRWLCCRHCSRRTPQPGTWVFIIFYGLDWVATVPPTIMLCREYFGAQTPIVFGWIFASHQLGAAVAAAGAGWLRDIRGDYDLAFYLAAGLCGLAALLCLRVRRAPSPVPA